MPNWTRNHVTIEGDAKALQQIKQTLATKHNPFDFNKLVPMPAALADIHAGMCVIDGERVDIWREKDGRSERISDAGREQLLADYGADNWYDWTLEHWGTKWNACQAEVIDSGNSLSYTFDTAWAAPEPIAGKLRALCANLGLRLEWTAECEGRRYNVIPKL